MKSLFVEYPKCSTCRKAKRFLKDNNIEFEDRDIVNENPSKEELLQWIKMSSIEPKKFFNTSGRLYKEMNLKDKVKNITAEEAADILKENGMLIKRPLLIKDNKIILGFKEDTYRSFIEEI